MLQSLSDSVMVCGNNNNNNRRNDQRSEKGGSEKPIIKQKHPLNVMTLGDTLTCEWLPEEMEDGFLEMKVGEVYNPSKFWIIRKDKLQGVKKLIKHLQLHYICYSSHYFIPDELLDVSLVCAGIVCGKYYRMEVVRIKNEKQVKVFCVDTGMIEMCERSTLRFLPRYFADLPRQAIRSRLHNLRPKHPDIFWSKNSARLFLDSVGDKELLSIINASDFKNKTLEITIYDTSTELDICINDLMVAKQAADYIIVPKNQNSIVTDTKACGNNLESVIPVSSSKTAQIEEKISGQKRRKPRRSRFSKSEQNLNIHRTEKERKKERKDICHLDWNSGFNQSEAAEVFGSDDNGPIIIIDSHSKYETPSANDALPFLEKPIIKQKHSLNVMTLGDTLTCEWLPEVMEDGFLEMTVGKVYDLSKFWIIRRDKCHDLNDLMENMQRQYILNPSHYFIPDELLDVSLVCAGIVCGKYYRLEVVRIKNEKQVKVFCVDTGMIEMCERSTLRFLPRYFADLPRQAIRSRLHNLRAKHPDSARLFLNSVRDKELVSIINSSDFENKILEITIYDTSTELDICINDLMVAKQAADYDAIAV